MDRAAAFVALHGDLLAAARARALAGAGSGQEVLALLGEPSAGVLACAQLATCADLRLLASGYVGRLCAALAAAQTADGAWWISGDDEDAAVHATGLLAGHLAKTRFPRPALLERAGDFLAERWSPDRVKDGRFHDLAAYATYFANAAHERGDEVLQWCGRELERGFRTRTLDAVRTTRVLVHSDAHSLPGARFERGELLVALLTEQWEDGSFGSSRAPADRVEWTLDGLAALQRFSRCDP